MDMTNLIYKTFLQETDFQTNTTKFNGNVDVGTNLTVHGDTTFNGEVNVPGQLDVNLIKPSSGTVVTVDPNLQVQLGLTVLGTTTLKGTGITGTLDVTGNTVTTGNASVSGTLTTQNVTVTNAATVNGTATTANLSVTGNATLPTIIGTQTNVVNSFSAGTTNAINTLTVDSVNSRVGINTETPTIDLDVNGPMTVSGSMVLRDKNTNTSIFTMNPANGDMTVLNPGNAVQTMHIAGSGTKIGIGYASGETSQGSGSIALGQNAGQTSQGVNAIAIGRAAGQTSQHDNSIVINATGTVLNTSAASQLLIAPLRQSATSGTRATLEYDTTTSEVTYVSRSINTIMTMARAYQYTANPTGSLYSNPQPYICGVTATNQFVNNITPTDVNQTQYGFIEYGRAGVATSWYGKYRAPVSGWYRYTLNARFGDTTSVYGLLPKYETAAGAISNTLPYGDGVIFAMTDPNNRRRCEYTDVIFLNKNDFVWATVGFTNLLVLWQNFNIQLIAY